VMPDRCCRYYAPMLPATPPRCLPGELLATPPFRQPGNAAKIIQALRDCC